MLPEHPPDAASRFPGSPARLSRSLHLSLPSLGSHGPTERLGQLSMLTYSHGGARGRVAFHGKALF